MTGDSIDHKHSMTGDINNHYTFMEKFIVLICAGFSPVPWLQVCKYNTTLRIKDSVLLKQSMTFVYEIKSPFLYTAQYCVKLFLEGFNATMPRSKVSRTVVLLDIMVYLFPDMLKVRYLKLLQKS